MTCIRTDYKAITMHTVERDPERLTLVMGRRRKKYVIWPKNLVPQTKHLTCRNSNTIGTLILLNPFAPTPPRSIPAKNNQKATDIEPTPISTPHQSSYYPLQHPSCTCNNAYGQAVKDQEVFVDIHRKSSAPSAGLRPF